MNHLRQIAGALQRMGPPGHILAHITPQEATLLKRRGGAGTRHPVTGLLHFDDRTSGADGSPGGPGDNGEAPIQVALLWPLIKKAAGKGADVALDAIAQPYVEQGWHALLGAIHNAWDNSGWYRDAMTGALAEDPTWNGGAERFGPTMGLQLEPITPRQGDHARGGAVRAPAAPTLPEIAVLIDGGALLPRPAQSRRGEGSAPLTLPEIARQIEHAQTRKSAGHGLTLPEIAARLEQRRRYGEGGEVDPSGGEHSSQSGASAEAGDIDASANAGTGFAGSPEIGGSAGRVSQAMALEQAGSLGNVGQRVGINEETGEFGLQGTVNPAGLAAGIVGGLVNPALGALAGWGARSATQGPAGMYGQGWIDIGGLQSVNSSYGAGRDPTGSAGGDNSGGYDPSPTLGASRDASAKDQGARPTQLRYDPLSADPARYGFGPEHAFFVPAAAGGIVGRKAGEGSVGQRASSHHRAGVGNAGRLIDHPSPGRADRIKTSVPANSYIVPADVVSGLGQGNTDAGARRLRRMLAKVPPRAPSVRAPMVPVRLSGGEYHVPPSRVAGLGGGDLASGARTLDRLIAEVRRRVSMQMRHAAPPKR